MTETEMLLWISKASYAELLDKWRFAPIGSPWFLGEVGAKFQEKFWRLRRESPTEELIAASKEVGWE